MSILTLKHLTDQQMEDVSFQLGLDTQGQFLKVEELKQDVYEAKLKLAKLQVELLEAKHEYKNLQMQTDESYAYKLGLGQPE